MDRTEQALIRAAARGDHAAFTELMRIHRARVYRVARRILGAHEPAEDVTQQVFLTMYRKLHTFRGASRLSTWLYRVTTNACYDHLRRERLPAQLDLDDVPASDADAATVMASREALATISHHIQTLPPKQRATVALRLGEELSFREIADVMGCSVGAAKVNYFHAIRRLRELLRREGVPGHAV